jgi:S1-C subfamily serine protease
MKNKILISLLIVGSLLTGFSLSSSLQNNQATADNLLFDEQEATVRAIKQNAEAVVSIMVYDLEVITAFDITTGEESVSTEPRYQGSGTGFLISNDGFIITNKHVVEQASEEHGEYQIVLNSGKKYYAQFIGKDPLSDIAVLKIFDKDLPYVELGNSDDLEIGMTVMTIGNALGRYRNSATKGIISGLGRNLQASDGNGRSMNLDNVIQTDAEINHGNSGGPLINLAGKVVGVNTAIDDAGSSIGFAIPVNSIKNVINSIREHGRIIRPYLGVRYTTITPEIALEEDLSLNYGALITSGTSDSAVMEDSPASRAGLLDGDIIFEINAIELDEVNTLFSIVQKYKAGDRIGLKIKRGDKVLIKTVTLSELK